MDKENQKPTTEASDPALSASLGSRYRLLMDGDTLQIGDEMLLDDAETWQVIGGANTVCSRWMIGATYRAQFFMPARRRNTPTNGKGAYE